jgi:hypothetical protein
MLKWYKNRTKERNSQPLLQNRAGKVCRVAETLQIKLLLLPLYLPMLENLKFRAFWLLINSQCCAQMPDKCRYVFIFYFITKYRPPQQYNRKKRLQLKTTGKRREGGKKDQDSE